MAVQTVIKVTDPLQECIQNQWDCGKP